MTNELFDKWLEKLRDPQTKQGFGGLQPTENCFCALGCLADVINPQGWVPSNETFRDWEDQKTGYQHTYRLPWRVTPNWLYDKVYKWNDTEKLTLPQIADKLEMMREEIVTQ